MASFDVRDLNVHNRGAVLVIISIIFNSLALALVAMRLATRMAVKCQLGPDDYAILLSLVGFTGGSSPTVLLTVSRSSPLDSLPAIVSVRVWACLGFR